MERTIKFRGKDLNTGEWRYGSHYDDNGEEYILPNLPGSATDYEYYQVDPNTVGQLTGIKDINGKEIYEGDIIYSEFCDKSGGNSLVGWNEKTSSFGIMDEYSYRSIEEGFDFAEFKNYVLLAHLKDALICEVIGNIHDNPELLNR